MEQRRFHRSLNIGGIAENILEFSLPLWSQIPGWGRGKPIRAGNGPAEPIHPEQLRSAFSYLEAAEAVTRS